ncbi:MAG: diguanylate phosphodiesterase [Acidobacteria bacterium]|nr:MAG: diguanylate phosphodiesterase [Acidobacteriota bacterium]
MHMEDKKDLFRKSEEFLQMISKTKEFTEELLKENERLRFRLASLESKEPNTDASEATQRRLEELMEKIKKLEAERQQLELRFRQVEEENKDFANRYLEIEEQNNNLANLYVASYQLHSTLDFNEVIRIVMEIIINLVGAETFCILLLDEKTNDLRMVANEGLDEYKNEKIQVGTGKIGTVAKSGEPYYINQEMESITDVDFYNPLACIPLKIKEHVIGVISIYKLFVQKEGFTAVDYELFTLLAGHAATAIFSSKLYSQSERKLSTIQGFLDLLTN